MMAGRYRLLVSGASGFVGQVLAETIRNHPQTDEISLLALAEPDGAVIDIRDAAAVADAIAAAAPTAVIHLAAIASPRLAGAEPNKAWAVNLMGTFNLADAVSRHAPDARFVFAGSSEAYGASFARAAGRPVDEDSALEPLTPYGATKAAADIMLGQMAHQGLKAIRFRPFNHTGPRQAAAYVIPAFARQIVRIERGWQEPVMRVGNLSVKRDFLDVRDVVSAYLTAAIDGPLGAFNLASGQPVAVGAMLERLLARTTAPIKVESDATLQRKDEVETICGDPARVRAAYAWEIRYGFEETLAEVLDYWRELANTAPHFLRD